MSDEINIAEMTVHAVLTRWPLTAKVFDHYSTLCIGCAIAPFCTISEAAKLYDLSLEAFVNDLENASSSDIAADS